MSTADWRRIEAWLDEQRVGDGPLRPIARLSGGTQNQMILVERGSQQLVLRMPPVHQLPYSNQTMRREIQVLAALDSTAVPHARLVASCATTDVTGSAFYLTEFVAGHPLQPGADPPHPGGTARELGLGLVDALATLVKVPMDHPQLRDFGSPDGWLERQVQRWSSQLRKYRGLPQPPDRLLPNLPAVADWLKRHPPASCRLGLIHGDYHVANVIFEVDRPSVAAIVDWELATIGGVLLDLGHLLATWPDAEATEAEAACVVLPIAGAPTPRELAERYEAATSLDTSDLLWFRVLACFRLAAILEGTYARACSGLAPIETGEALHAKSLALLEQAKRLIVGP